MLEFEYVLSSGGKIEIIQIFVISHPVEQTSVDL